MGAGFIMGDSVGYRLCAMSIGKIDAMVYILGASQGFLFAETYPLIEKMAMATTGGR
jgi:hypothetical protein